MGRIAKNKLHTNLTLGKMLQLCKGMQGIPAEVLEEPILRALGYSVRPAAERLIHKHTARFLFNPSSAQTPYHLKMVSMAASNVEDAELLYRAIGKILERINTTQVPEQKTLLAEQIARAMIDIGAKTNKKFRPSAINTIREWLPIFSAPARRNMIEMLIESSAAADLVVFDLADPTRSELVRLTKANSAQAQSVAREKIQEMDALVREKRIREFGASASRITSEVEILRKQPTNLERSDNGGPEISSEQWQKEFFVQMRLNPDSSTGDGMLRKIINDATGTEFSKDRFAAAINLLLDALDVTTPAGAKTTIQALASLVAKVEDDDLRSHIIDQVKPALVEHKADVIDLLKIVTDATIVQTLNELASEYISDDESEEITHSKMTLPLGMEIPTTYSYHERIIRYNNAIIRSKVSPEGMEVTALGDNAIEIFTENKTEIELALAYMRERFNASCRLVVDHVDGRKTRCFVYVPYSPEKSKQVSDEIGRLINPDIIDQKHTSLIKNFTVYRNSPLKQVKDTIDSRLMQRNEQIKNHLIHLVTNAPGSKEAWSALIRFVRASVSPQSKNSDVYLVFSILSELIQTAPEEGKTQLALAFAYMYQQSPKVLSPQLAPQIQSVLTDNIQNPKQMFTEISDERFSLVLSNLMGSPLSQEDQAQIHLIQRRKSMFNSLSQFRADPSSQEAEAYLNNVVDIATSEDMLSENIIFDVISRILESVEEAKPAGAGIAADRAAKSIIDIVYNVKGTLRDDIISFTAQKLPSISPNTRKLLVSRLTRSKLSPDKRDLRVFDLVDLLIEELDDLRISAASSDVRNLASIKYEKLAENKLLDLLVENPESYEATSMISQAIKDAKNSERRIENAFAVFTQAISSAKEEGTKKATIEKAAVAISILLSQVKDESLKESLVERSREAFSSNINVIGRSLTRVRDTQTSNTLIKIMEPYRDNPYTALANAMIGFRKDPLSAKAKDHLKVLADNLGKIGGKESDFVKNTIAEILNSLTPLPQDSREAIQKEVLVALTNSAAALNPESGELISHLRYILTHHKQLREIALRALENSDPEGKPLMDVRAAFVVLNLNYEELDKMREQAPNKFVQAHASSLFDDLRRNEFLNRFRMSSSSDGVRKMLNDIIGQNANEGSVERLQNTIFLFSDAFEVTDNYGKDLLAQATAYIYSELKDESLKEMIMNSLGLLFADSNHIETTISVLGRMQGKGFDALSRMIHPHLSPKELETIEDRIGKKMLRKRVRTTTDKIEGIVVTVQKPIDPEKPQEDEVLRKTRQSIESQAQKYFEALAPQMQGTDLNHAEALLRGIVQNVSHEPVSLENVLAATEAIIRSTEQASAENRIEAKALVANTLLGLLLHLNKDEYLSGGLKEKLNSDMAPWAADLKANIVTLDNLSTTQKGVLSFIWDYLSEHDKNEIMDHFERVFYDIPQPIEKSTPEQREREERAVSLFRFLRSSFLSSELIEDLAGNIPNHRLRNEAEKVCGERPATVVSSIVNENGTSKKDTVEDVVEDASEGLVIVDPELGAVHGEFDLTENKVTPALTHNALHDGNTILSETHPKENAPEEIRFLKSSEEKLTSLGNEYDIAPHEVEHAIMLMVTGFSVPYSQINTVHDIQERLMFAANQMKSPQFVDIAIELVRINEEKNSKEKSNKVVDIYHRTFEMDRKLAQLVIFCLRSIDPGFQPDEVNIEDKTGKTKGWFGRLLGKK
jgi:hypothetical protein